MLRCDVRVVCVWHSIMKRSMNEFCRPRRQLRSCSISFYDVTTIIFHHFSHCVILRISPYISTGVVASDSLFSFVPFLSMHLHPT